MNNPQLKIDFQKDVRKRKMTYEESIEFNETKSSFKQLKITENHNILILKLLFEEYFIELIDDLIKENLFKDDWNLEKDTFGYKFYISILAKNEYTELQFTEFLISIICNDNNRITKDDWINNDTNDYNFDKKIIIQLIESVKNNCTEVYLDLFLAYTKMWNYYKIYKRPFNNSKAIIIYKTFIESIKPGHGFTYSKFEKFTNQLQCLFLKIGLGNLFIPILDSNEYAYFSPGYVLKRKEFESKISNLFDYENTDESEAYANLINQLILNPEEETRDKLIATIQLKLQKKMLPTEIDVKLFCILLSNNKYKDLGKLLLSKFYLYNHINY